MQMAAFTIKNITKSLILSAFGFCISGGGFKEESCDL